MSCAVRDLRRSVPGLSSTTDKATVMEVTLDYLHYLQRIVGTSHDAVSLTDSCALTYLGKFEFIVLSNYRAICLTLILNF